VKVARAALGDKADLAGRRPAVFGAVVSCQNLNLLNRVDILRAKHGSGGTGASRDGAIHRHNVLIRAAAVDTEATIAHAVRIESADGSACNSRLKQCEVNRVPAVQCEIFDLLGLDHASHLRTLGLYLASRRFHFDRFRYASDSQRQIYIDLLAESKLRRFQLFS